MDIVPKAHELVKTHLSQFLAVASDFAPLAGKGGGEGALAPLSPSPKARDKRAPAIKVLNRVVDSLDVRLLEYAHPSKWLAEQVKEWREQRDAWEPGSKPLVVQVGELGSFVVRPDKRPYEFALVNAEIGVIRIWNPDKWLSSWQTKTGQLYVSFRSGFLQKVGVEAVRPYLNMVKQTLCGERAGVTHEGFVRVARGDLAVDLQLRKDIGWNDVPKFVCRSRKREYVSTLYGEEPEKVAKRIADTFCEALPPIDNKGGANYTASTLVSKALSEFAEGFSKKLRTKDQGTLEWVVAQRDPQTLYFGRFASQLYGRIYNKKASLAVQNKLYMLDHWLEAGWDAEAPVWRIEFSLSGDYLKDAIDVGTGEKDLRELETFLEAIPRIWQYLTRDWLRHTNPKKDTNESRWGNSRFWDAVEGAWPDDAVAVRGKKERNPNVEQMEAQVDGVGLTIAALVATSDGDTKGLAEIGRRFIELASSPNGMARVLERQRRYGLDELSDTAQSAALRASFLREGCGS